MSTLLLQVLILAKMSQILYKKILICIVVSFIIVVIVMWSCLPFRVLVLFTPIAVVNHIIARRRKHIALRQNHMPQYRHHILQHRVQHLLHILRHVLHRAKDHHDIFHYVFRLIKDPYIFA